jgi:hypothetical protein
MNLFNQNSFIVRFSGKTLFRKGKTHLFKLRLSYCNMQL